MKKIQRIDDITAADWEDIKRRREEGATLDQVGELYGMAGSTLSRYAKLAGVDIPRRADYIPLPSVADIQRLRDEGMKWADIAAKYHVSRDRLQSYAREHGIDTRLVRKPTLVEVDWDDVRRQREAGKTWDDIAELYGISGATLHKRADGRGIDIGPSRYDRIDAMLDPSWPGWEEVKQMRKHGGTWTEIAEHVGVSTLTLHRLMVRMALRAPTEKMQQHADDVSNREAKTMYTQTLCWSCANAVPDKYGKRGCAWSRRFEPVKGWDAQETRLYAGDGSKRFQKSYCVRQCPEFVRG